eukprot:10261366-Alexandrium_andersonii.AAC.1
MLIHARRASSTPIVAHRTQSWQIDKNVQGGTKRGTAAVRLVHGFCPWWRCWFRGMRLAAQTRGKVPSCSC